MAFAAIEAERVRLGMTIEALARAAGLVERHYRKLRSGRHAPRAATLARLSQALNRVRTGYGADERAMAPGAAFSLAVTLAAQLTGSDMRNSLAHLPQRRAVQDADWAAAARCRMIAYAVMNGTLGFSTSAVARAAGVTKGTVSKGIREIEDRRDTDMALDDVLNRLEAVFQK